MKRNRPPANRSGAAAPWGGIVPAGLGASEQPQHAPQAPAQGAEGAPPVVDPPSAEDRVLRRLTSIDDRLGRLCEWGEDDHPPELLPIVFDGGSEPQRIRVRDDHGLEAASYGIYNPTAVPIYVAFNGGSPTLAAGAFPVPSPGWMVVPILVGSVVLGADPVVLGVGQATIYRLRFPTYQAFAMGKL